MRPIPQKLRNEIEQSGMNRRCALDTGVYGICEGSSEWHHVWIYAGRHINEFWAIGGCCKKHHKQVNELTIIKKAFQIASLRRAIPEDLQKYTREDWGQIMKYIGYTEEHIEEPPF